MIGDILKNKKIIINGIILTITSLILRTIGLYFSIYISNKIGSTATGIFQLLMSVYAFFVTFALSGFNLACTRIVTEDLAKNKIENIKNTVKKCLLYSSFFGATSSFLLCILTPFFARNILHNQLSNITFYIISISLPFISMSSTLNGYFLAVQKVSKTAIIQIIEQIINITIIVFFINTITCANADFAIFSLVAGESISAIISFFILYFTYIFDRKKIQNSRYEDQNLSKKILHISMPVAITSYIRSFLSSFKQILIPIGLQSSGLTHSDSLSFYGIINGMVFPIILFPNIIINAFSRVINT